MKFKWTEVCEAAFGELKHALSWPPLLIYSNYEEPFILTGDVLSQGKIGEDRPIAYANRTLHLLERRY